MSSSSVIPRGVSDFVSIYTYEEHICIFRTRVKVSSLENEDQVILEICLPSERVTSPATFDPSSFYFYFYFPFISNMIVLFPLSAYSMETIMFLNVAPSQLFLNRWGYIMPL